MTRNMIAAAFGALLAGGILAAAPAEAAPSFCDRHGTGPGLTYIHACAEGDGGFYTIPGSPADLANGE